MNALIADPLDKDPEEGAEEIRKELEDFSEIFGTWRSFKVQEYMDITPTHRKELIAWDFLLWV